ncbi:hypothetical protein [Fontibacillus sp. BL9]|uniref:DUF7408 domain-containing protein n=1 Tax=Fontibacillus sp. BL9 TaxID=3389971 RepID=UPI00397B4442
MLFSIKRCSAIVLFVLAVMIGMGTWVPQSAYAAGPSISIQSDIGFGGYVKSNEWSPVTITLTSDADVSGELVVQAEEPYSGTSVSHVKKVDLPAGTTKAITFGILGNSFNNKNNEIRFYEGSAESGKYIPFSSGKPYLQSSDSSRTLIGVLAADPDSMNFLAATNGTGNNAIIIPLKGEEIPEDGVLLSTLDILVLNNYPTDTLADKQIKAVRSWVNLGGTLVLGGGQGYAKTAQGFEDLSPVEFKGGADASSLPELVQVGGKPLTLSESFPLSSAVVKDGARPEISSGNLPLFASWTAGKGRVIYAAYDMAMEPLHGWGGHAEVWNTVLREEISENSATMGGWVSRGNFMSSVSYLLDLFPSLTLPPFSLLLWLLLGYAILVAPVLYYVLKKFDKREWAWGLIPLIAVIASVGIYFAGTSGKSSVRMHTLNIVELDGRGQAIQSTATALFVPRGGTYHMSFPAGTYVSVTREGGLLGGGQSGGSNRQLIRVNPEGTDVKLRDMTHRSIAKLWLSKPEPIKSGAMKIDVSYDAKGNLQGTVTNGTNGELSDGALLVGGKVYRFGELPQGKSVQVPVSTSSAAYQDYGSVLFPQTAGGSDDYLLERQRGMINQYMVQGLTSDNPVFIAWNKAELNDYKVNGKVVASEQLNMFVQSFAPSFTHNGEMTIPFGLIGARITETTSKEWSVDGAGRVNLSPGEATVEYELPKNEDIQYSQLELRWTYQGQQTTVMIWNQESGTWEDLGPFNKFQAKFTTTANSYLMNGYLKIKITAGEWDSFDLPEIALKGRTGK